MVGIVSPKRELPALCNPFLFAAFAKRRMSSMFWSVWFLSIPSESNAPAFTKLSKDFLFRSLCWIRVSTSSNVWNGPRLLRSSMIAFVISEPTFFTASSPNRIFAPSGVKLTKLLLMSGGRIYARLFRFLNEERDALNVAYLGVQERRHKFFQIMWLEICRLVADQGVASR